jgi:chaperone required for assembly of F1-ATPase
MYFIFQTIFFSILLIAMFHYFWNYFKDLYSPKKTRDLVGSQTQKYKNILDEILRNNQLKKENLDINEKERQELIEDAAEFMRSMEL